MIGGEICAPKEEVMIGRKAVRRRTAAGLCAGQCWPSHGGGRTASLGVAVLRLLLHCRLKKTILRP